MDGRSSNGPQKDSQIVEGMPSVLALVRVELVNSYYVTRMALKGLRIIRTLEYMRRPRVLTGGLHLTLRPSQCQKCP